MQKTLHSTPLLFCLEAVFYFTNPTVMLMASWVGRANSTNLVLSWTVFFGFIWVVFSKSCFFVHCPVFFSVYLFGLFIYVFVQQRQVASLAVLVFGYIYICMLVVVYCFLCLFCLFCLCNMLYSVQIP